MNKENHHLTFSLLDEQNYASAVASISLAIKSGELPNLAFSKIDFSSLQCQCLIQLIDGSVNLQSLSFTECCMTITAFESILEAIAQHPGITRLSFCSMTMYLYPPDHQHNPYVYLDIGYTSIDDNHAKIIASMLIKNNSIRELHLYDNIIENEGALAILSALQNHTQLWKISFSKSYLSKTIDDNIRAAIELFCLRNRGFVLNAKIIQPAVSPLVNPNNAEQQAPFLPVDMINRILFFSDPFAITRAANVSRHWRHAANLQWRTRLINEFPEFAVANRALLSGEASYFQLYLTQKRNNAIVILQTIPAFPDTFEQSYTLLDECTTDTSQLESIISSIETYLYSGYDVTQIHILNDHHQNTTVLFVLCMVLMYVANNTECRLLHQWQYLQNKLYYVIELALALGADPKFVNTYNYSIVDVICFSPPDIQKALCRLLKIYQSDFDQNAYIQRALKTPRWTPNAMITFLEDIALPLHQQLDLIISYDNPQLLNALLNAHNQFDFGCKNQLEHTPLVAAMHIQRTSRSRLANLPIFLLLMKGAGALIEDALGLAKQLQLSQPLINLLSEYSSLELHNKKFLCMLLNQDDNEDPLKFLSEHEITLLRSVLPSLFENARVAVLKFH
ncbi:MAG: hypothetical protein M3R00_05475 [Pseudomonadota bacterium]|nr:hypothetical protein [Pseudomonadota bacterium]